MVMEASPSPQSVGREFVRQYYTLLNKAPAHLHRFYNNYSSFVHGGLDAPNRETLPVVGQKQIHNRIQQLNFRDCHAKISQVDAQATLGSGVVVQVTGELSNAGAPMRRFTQTFVLAAQSPKKYYVHNDIFRYQDIVFSDDSGSGSGCRSDGEEEEGGAYFPPPPAFPPAPFPPAPLPPLNGHPPALHPPSLSSEEPSAPEPVPEPEPPAPQQTPVEPEPLPPAAPSSPPAPKTYANLLKSVSGGAPAPGAAAGAAGGGARAAGGAGRGARRAGAEPRRYSDLQQVFVGNVPVGAGEEALRALFARFGAVAELRLHCKPGAPRQPAYGFVTYEAAGAAAECLAAAQSGALYFPPDAPDAVKLNVEEKKARRRLPPAPRSQPGAARGRGAAPRR